MSPRVRRVLLTALTLLFVLLTFAGGIYVLAHRGQVSAGYAVIPAVFALALLSARRQEKQ